MENWRKDNEHPVCPALLFCQLVTIIVSWKSFCAEDVRVVYCVFRLYYTT
jgi:hypothetical protein